MSLIISVMSITAFVMVTVYMFARAKFAATRRVAMLPLAMTGMEMATFGLLSGVSNPTVMLLLIAARVALLVVCMMAMHRDREEAKARVRRRNRFHADMINVMQPSLRLVPRRPANGRADTVA